MALAPLAFSLYSGFSAEVPPEATPGEKLSAFATQAPRVTCSQTFSTHAR
jgi:hypothetical protein